MPEKIPHIAPTPTHANGNGQNGQEKGQISGSPEKSTFLHRESSLNREASADDMNNEEVEQKATS